MGTATRAGQLSGDKELALKAVQADPRSFQCIADELKGDLGIVHAALEQYCARLEDSDSYFMPYEHNEFADEEHRQEFVQLIFDAHGSDEIRGDWHAVNKALDIDVWALKYASSRLSER